MYHFHKIIEIGQQEGARNFVQLFFNSGPLCNVKKCTNEFLDPKIPYLDTKIIEIGQQEGAINFVQFFQFWPAVRCLEYTAVRVQSVV